jgi:predicted GNAT family acetyltransferase
MAGETHDPAAVSRVGSMATETGIRVVDVRDRSRYEALDADGRLMGFADYRLLADTISFTHAETLPNYRGRGVAATIAGTSLDDARDAGLRVRPDCPFYATFIEEHPQYADLVA